MNRIAAGLLVLLSASVAVADAGDLFAGKGEAPASQPIDHVIGVNKMVPASQPAARVPTTRPEVLTLRTLIDRIPPAIMSGKELDTQNVLGNLANGKHITLTNVRATFQGSMFRLEDAMRNASAPKHILLVRLNCHVDDKVLKRTPSRPIRVDVEAVVKRLSLRTNDGGATLHVDCQAVKIAVH